MSIYGIGDDEEQMRQLFGSTPLDDQQVGFQAQPPPDLQYGLFGNVGADASAAQKLEDMIADGSDIAALMAQGAQGATSMLGQQRIAQQQQANQAAMQQDQQSKGGGLLGSLLKMGANIALQKWLGTMFAGGSTAAGTAGTATAAAAAV